MWCVASVVETRWAAAETPQGGQGYPRGPSGLFSAAYRRPARRVCPSGARVRPDACGLMLCFPHERGRAGALLRPPLWPSLGVASCVAAASVP